MEQQELTPERIANTASNWISSALAIPIVWPKTTALVSLVIITVTAGIWAAPLVRSDKPPAPNHRLLNRMVQDAEQAEQEFEAKRGLTLQRNPEARGVWEMMRDPTQASETEP